MTAIFGAGGINFFGNHYTSLYLNNNGNVSFGGQLSAYIATPMPVEDALACLDRLDEEWFLSQPAEIRRVFNFNLDFA